MQEGRWFAGTPALHVAASAHPRTMTAIAIYRAKSWRQRAVVGGWLLRCARSTINRLIVIPQQPNLHHQGAHQFRIQLFPPTTTQRCRQDNVAKSGANQTANGQTHALEHTPHLAITPFIERHTVPTIATFTTDELNHPETRGTIIKRNTIQ